MKKKRKQKKKIEKKNYVIKHTIFNYYLKKERNVLLFYIFFKY